MVEEIKEMEEIAFHIQGMSESGLMGAKHVIQQMLFYLNRVEEIDRVQMKKKMEEIHQECMDLLSYKFNRNEKK